MQNLEVKNDKGFALVSTLWVISLLSVIALGISSNAKRDAQIAQNYLAAAQAEQLLSAGIQTAIFDLLTQPRSRNTGLFSKTYRTNAGQIKIDVRDEAGKVDLNTASWALLEKLISSAVKSPEETSSIIDAIFDWRDADSTKRPYGAEISSYSSLDKSGSIKNDKFEYIDELAHVAGISPIIFRELKPSITTISKKRGIDPSFASNKLIGAILGNAEKNSEQLAEATSLSNNYRSNIAKLGQLGVSRRLFSSPSRSAYSIIAEATMKSGAQLTKEVTAVVTRGNFEIHSW